MKVPRSKFMEILLAGAEMIRADRQTDTRNVRHGESRRRMTRLSTLSIFCWPCYDSWQITNLTRNSFLSIYFNSLHVLSNLVLIIRRINCVNITSGIRHPVPMTVSCVGRKGTFQPAHETVTATEWHISNVVLIKLILLMMSTRLLEICRELK
jgi:hypothetical protein